jgi:hypothetical protein
VRLITDHWYRAETTAGPCLFNGCGRPQAEHRDTVAEWLEPRHWFRPTRGALTRCARCARPFGHSTHHGTARNLRLWHRPRIPWRTRR